MITPTWKSELLLEPRAQRHLPSSPLWLGCAFEFSPHLISYIFCLFDQLIFLEGTETFYNAVQHMAITYSCPSSIPQAKSQAFKTWLPWELGCVRKDKRTHSCRSIRGQRKGYLAEQYYRFVWITAHHCYNYLIVKVCLKREAKVCGKLSFLYKSLLIDTLGESTMSQAVQWGACIPLPSTTSMVGPWLSLSPQLHVSSAGCRRISFYKEHMYLILNLYSDRPALKNQVFHWSDLMPLSFFLDLHQDVDHLPLFSFAILSSVICLV